MKEFEPKFKKKNTRTKPKTLQWLLKNPKLKIKEPLRKILPANIQEKIYFFILSKNQKKPMIK